MSDKIEQVTSKTGVTLFWVATVNVNCQPAAVMLALLLAEQIFSKCIEYKGLRGLEDSQ